MHNMTYNSIIVSYVSKWGDTYSCAKWGNKYSCAKWGDTYSCVK